MGIVSEGLDAFQQCLRSDPRITGHSETGPSTNGVRSMCGQVSQLFQDRVRIPNRRPDPLHTLEDSRRLRIRDG